MKRTKIPILILLTIMILSSLSSLSAITIDELIDSGLAHNSIIQKNRLQTELIEAKKEESRANRFGEFDVVGSYTHYNLPRTLAPIVPSSLSPNSSVETTQELFTTGVQYSVPLFTGGALEQQVEIDQVAKSMTEIKAKLSREELIYNIRSLYLSGLSLQELISSQNHYIDALQSLTEIISQSVTLGKKAKIDLIKSNSSLQDAKGKLTQIESSLKMIKSTLSATTHTKNIDYLQPIVVDVTQQAQVDNPSMEGLDRFRLQDLEIDKSSKIISKVKSTQKPQVVLNSYW
jgi:outer membrane protein TolC